MLGSHHNLRPLDVEAVRRLRDRGPLTIPHAYDCGHKDTEATGHGMNRLVAAGYAVYYRWDPDEDDGLWILTERGRSALTRIEAE